MDCWTVADSLTELTATIPACNDDPSPEMEVDDVVFVKSQIGENVNRPGNIKLYETTTTVIVIADSNQTTS